MALFKEDIEFTTTLINVYFLGKHHSNGTGFFVLKVYNGKTYLYLVTNRHVLEVEDDNDPTIKYDADKIILNILHKGSGPTQYEIDLKKNKKVCSAVKDIDIAIVFLSKSKLPLELSNIRALDINVNAWSSKEYMDKGGYNGSNIAMIGYPISTTFPYIDTPMFRRGYVARISQTDITLIKNFVLDIQNFPGNSGSPVFCLPDPAPIDGTDNINELRLIGIVHSYVHYKHKISGYYSGGKPVEIKENTGLAMANPVEFIREIIDDDVVSR